MGKQSQYPTAGDDRSEIKQVHITPGNVMSPVEGFSSDAGLGKPPTVGCYGAPGDGEIPTGEKMGGGTGRAIKAFFKGNGGGKP
jgi:hypothetical protein